MCQPIPMACRSIACGHNVPEGEDFCAECQDLVKPGETKPAAEQASEQPLEMVNHPKHYNSHPSGIECIDVVEHFGFNLGNTIKYLWRAEEKGAPLQDLEKARWYLDREIQKRQQTAAA